jgi:hypothetical protein
VVGRNLGQWSVVGGQWSVFRRGGAGRPVLFFPPAAGGNKYSGPAQPRSMSAMAILRQLSLSATHQPPLTTAITYTSTRRQPQNIILRTFGAHPLFTPLPGT